MSLTDTKFEWMQIINKIAGLLSNNSKMQLALISLKDKALT